MIQLVQPSRGHITQWFAATQGDGKPHAGQDYAYRNNATGEIFPEVFAAADGVVLFAGDARGLSWPNIMYLNPDFNRSDNVDESAGNYTIIAHYDPAGRQVALTGYGHQEEIWVKAGDAVRALQRIGTVGATGFSAGKHLHFDLVLFPFDVDDAPFYGRVDPNPYFTGSLSYAGESITPIQEDDMAADTEFVSKDGKKVTLQDLLNSIDTKVEAGRNEATNAKVLAKEARDIAQIAANEATNAKVAAREAVATLALLATGAGADKATVKGIVDEIAERLGN